MEISSSDRGAIAGSVPDITDAEHVRVRLAAVPESVGQARRLIVALAAGALCEPTARDTIALAVSEAVSNVVLHAYRDRDGDLELFAIRVRGELIVSISDSGRGRSAATSSPGLGYGMALIRESADAVSIRDGSGAGTVVQLRFALGGGQSAIAAA